MFPPIPPRGRIVSPEGRRSGRSGSRDARPVSGLDGLSAVPNHVPGLPPPLLLLLLFDLVAGDGFPGLVARPPRLGAGDGGAHAGVRFHPDERGDDIGACGPFESGLLRPLVLSEVGGGLRRDRDREQR